MSDTKTCSKCNVPKSIKDFHVDKSREDGHRTWCKACVAKHGKQYLSTPEGKKKHVENVKRYYKKKGGAEYRHKWNLKFLYGISSEDYNKIFEQQKGCCAICGKHQSEFKRNLHLDHDHSTNVIRGLLCNNCNLGLGKFKDNPILLRKAADYLDGC